MYYFDYSQPLFRPPSEARSLIFQITLGCSQNSCTFCGMYKMKQFRLRGIAEIKAE
ncbi:MAG: radical SAM protein, partial [Geopsychrobacter sp.]|nr:radical SAM protein [Geopsychrobacter sp.]